jgi:hypothetical protein
MDKQASSAGMRRRAKDAASATKIAAQISALLAMSRAMWCSI